MSAADGAASGNEERRTSERFSVVVPATLRVGSDDYTAKILNIVHDGAMLETAAPLEIGSPVTLRCGTVAADAVVVWCDASRIGIQFETALSDAEIAEQISRSTALENRRNSKQRP